MQGPNTSLGHTSVSIMLEAQIAYIVAAIRYMQRHNVTAIEPRPDAQAAFVRDVDERMQGTVWAAGGCHSWDIDATGRISSLWPRATWHFRRRVASFLPAEYHTTSIPPRPLAPVGGTPPSRVEMVGT
jgi:hypothetical protein